MEALTRDLSWSSERLSLAELRERHPSLPAIVKVVHGYCGDTENESLSNEQMLILHMWIKQSRVVAQNDAGRIISIPVNAQQLFDLHPANKNSTGTGLLISSILKTSTLPVEVTFNPKSHTSFNISGQSYRSETFGKLTLLSSHKITYAIASTLDEGELEVGDLFAVPTYRRIDLVLPSSLNGHQTALLQDHTRRVGHLLDRYAESPSSQEFSCLPSIGIIDYGKVLAGETKASSANTITPTHSGSPVKKTPDIVIHDAPDDHDASSLSDAVNRFTHYQELLSSHSPATQRKAGIRPKSAAPEETPKRHTFGPQPPRSPKTKDRPKSLAESILMLQGLGTKLADKPKSPTEKVESGSSENNNSGPNGTEEHSSSKEDMTRASTASTHL